MKNTYDINLMNDQGVVFDSADFTSLKEAKKWAQGRGGKYHARIHKNGSDEATIYTPNK